MKRIINSITLIFFITIFNIFLSSDVNAASNPYKQNSSYGTNCTWYAWKMANEKAGVKLPGWGNAKDWYKDAKNDGYTVGTTPKANSIIVWGNWTSYGHVGYVESVKGNILYIWDSTGPCIDKNDPEYIECMANGVSEESDKICKANAKKSACEYTISPDQYGITGYIYLDVAPKKQTTTPSKNSNSSSNNKTNKKEETGATKSETKSSNTNLSSIEISNGTLQFDKDILDYNLEVENDIDKITINATLEDKKSTLNGTGEYELKNGLNEIKLTVKAEDNTTKEYIIRITRKERVEDKLESKPDKSNTKKEENTSKKDHNNTFILILSICFIIILIIILTIIFIQNKKKKSKSKRN